MSELWMTKTKEGSNMVRTLGILWVVFFLASCSSRSEQKETSVNDQISHTQSSPLRPELPSLNAVPDLAHTWDADLYLVNFDADQEAKVKKAVEIIKKVISSAEFRDRVYAYQFKGERTFFNNHGFTNEEIYQQILEGAEQMGNKAKNNMMNVELELYHQKTKTIGYTYPNTVRIWMNRKYFNRYTPIKVADNLMHEWMHKLGFTHDVSWSHDRDHSVPYAIGYLIEELAEKYQ